MSIYKRSGVARLYATHFFTHGVIEGAEPFSPLLFSLRLWSFVYSAGITCGTHSGRWDTTKRRPPTCVPSGRVPRFLTEKSATEQKVVSRATWKSVIARKMKGLLLSELVFRPFFGLSVCAEITRYRSQIRSICTRGTNSICRGSVTFLSYRNNLRGVLNLVTRCPCRAIVNRVSEEYKKIILRGKFCFFFVKSN